jgi:hypothetical protein
MCRLSLVNSMLRNDCGWMFSFRPRLFTFEAPKLSRILLDVLRRDNQFLVVGCALRPYSFWFLLLWLSSVWAAAWELLLSWNSIRCFFSLMRIVCWVALPTFGLLVCTLMMQGLLVHLLQPKLSLLLSHLALNLDSVCVSHYVKHLLRFKRFLSNWVPTGTHLARGYSRVLLVTDHAVLLLGCPRIDVNAWRRSKHKMELLVRRNLLVTRHLCLFLLKSLPHLI